MEYIRDKKQSADDQKWTEPALCFLNIIFILGGTTLNTYSFKANQYTILQRRGRKTWKPRNHFFSEFYQLRVFDFFCNVIRKLREMNLTGTCKLSSRLSNSELLYFPHTKSENSKLEKLRVTKRSVILLVSLTSRLCNSEFSYLPCT